jgi:hypothetical protein
MRILAIDKDTKLGILEVSSHELLQLYLYRGEADPSLRGANPKAGDEINVGRNPNPSHPTTQKSEGEPS